MLEEKTWFKSLSEGQKRLAKQALALLRQQKNIKAEFHDYSFVVFPMAKAYEGYLKKRFLEMGFIDRRTYEGNRFRIGKALNPALPVRHRGRWWLYGPLAESCGEALPKRLWQAWKQCRNLLFHFFPKERQFISLAEAEQRLKQLEEAMSLVTECGVDKKNIVLKE